MKRRVRESSSIIIILVIIILLACACVKITAKPGVPQVQETANFAVANMSISPAVVEVKQPITVTVDVTNPADISGTSSVALIINSAAIESKKLKLSSRATERLTFTFTRETPGVYQIQISPWSGYVIVTERGKKLLDVLASSYPELHKELLKLPDLAAIDSRDDEAIRDIAFLALNPRNRETFDQLLNEGIKEKRKYAGALEALLWIAYDKDFDKEDPLANYNIRRLVTTAWKTTTMSNDFKSDKWQDFNTVAYRLSSPRLLSLFMTNNIKYDQSEAAGLRSAGHAQLVPASETFASKKGICNDMTVFAQHCLIINGYRYENLFTDGFGAGFIAMNAADTAVGHAVCLVRENDMVFTIDNGTLRGPFPNIETAINTSALIAGMRNWTCSLYDIDIKKDLTIRESMKRITADSVKVSNVLQDKVLNEWPATTVLIQDPVGDILPQAKDKRAGDIKTVKGYMDNQYVYSSIQVTDNVDSALKKMYFVDIDFDNDRVFEYEFGFRPGGYCWVLDKTIDKNNSKTEDAWWVVIASLKDTIEIKMPRKEYGIPSRINIRCAIAEGATRIDQIDWFKLP